MNISVVVLHYQSFEETVKCIESFSSYNDVSNIIIVCNGSSNDSDSKIASFFKGRDSVFVLSSPSNLGFAKGMNIGFSYAKNKLNSDLIVCLNNDTRINQPEFFTNLRKYAEEHLIGVIGPDIINRDGIHQNPSYIYSSFLDYAKKEYQFAINGIRRCKLFFGLPELFYCVRKKIFINKKKSKPIEKHIVLHGACLIFGPQYFSKFNGLFDKTFLYGEESILSALCEISNIKIEYLNALKLLHNEAVSTRIGFKSTVKRHKFYYENILNSRKELLKIVRGEYL